MANICKYTLNIYIDLCIYKGFMYFTAWDPI